MLAYAYILTYEGYPRVYSGRIDVDDEAISNLLSIRRSYAAGPAVTLHAGRDVYVFEREGDLLVGLNRSSEWRTVEVATSWERQSLTDHSSNAEAVRTGADGQVELSIPPTGWVCYAP
jgi:alpha-amylase